MNGLNDTEFRVMDELYFVTAYNELLELTVLDEGLLNKTLFGLIVQGLVHQMKYNANINDFEKLEQADTASFFQSSFVATRQGLLMHNMRS